MDRDNRRYRDYDRDYERDRRSYDRDRGYDRRDRYDDEPRRRSGSSRNRRRRRSGLSGSMTYILMVCLISAVLAAVGWTLGNDMLALNKKEATGVVSITQDGDVASAADQLKDQHIIKYKGLFRLFCAFAGGSEKISAGIYNVNTDLDYRAILNSLGSSSSRRMTVEVTIPEGYTLRQIFALLEDKGVSTVEKLEDMAANHDYAFSFLQDIPLGEATRLEGYLFPDTYEFYAGEDPKYILNKMLVNFDAKVNDSIRQQIWDKGYSIGDILTIASMIEKESDGTDRTAIASVIYNRLNNPGAGTMGYLQVDATIQYVLPEGQVVKESDYEGVDSPYNTYKHKGLPPGPISNPGMESIMAAINPQSTNYYYYALGDDKVHHFFSSYSEFQNFLHS